MERTLHSTLDTSDDDRCHGEPGYSPYVAHGLGRVHRSIRRALAGSQRFDDARHELLPLLALHMCPHQRLRAYYLSGMILARSGDYTAALARLAAALDLAYEVGDRGAIAEIAHLQGGVHRNVGEFARGADCQTLCLETLWELTPDGKSVDPALELGCLVDMAVVETALADFDRASWCLGEAERMARMVSGISLDKALILWMQALVHRYLGTPWLALSPAMQACDAYAASGSAAFLARIQTVVADIAMDAAETFEPEKPYMARDAMLDLAKPYVVQATPNARAAEDRPGEGLALLALARYYQLSGQNTDRLKVIESVITMAEKLDDTPLAGQAYIALGAELAALGASRDVEIRSYEKAIAILAKSDAHAIELQATRALLRAQEMRT